MDSHFGQPRSTKHYAGSMMNQRISNQKKSKRTLKEGKRKSSCGSKKRSGANSSLSLAKDDYKKCSSNFRYMNQACNKITIETSKNSSMAHNNRPGTCTGKPKIGAFKARSGKYKKTKKTSTSPLLSRRASKGTESARRQSSKLHKNGSCNSKRSLKNEKGKLKILINDLDHSPTSIHTGNWMGYPSSRVYDTCKSKKSLKSCKSMRNIESKSYSCRNRKEEQKMHKSKNNRSARDNKATYSNYLASEPLSKISMFNNLIGAHGPKRSIDSGGTPTLKKDRNSLGSNKGGSVKCSRKSSNKKPKICVYDSNQYTSNMYANEYTNSAQTSQFTFGAGPDSKASDNGLSGTTSANKSINKDNVVKRNSDASSLKK